MPAKWTAICTNLASYSYQDVHDFQSWVYLMIPCPTESQIRTPGGPTLLHPWFSNSVGAYCFTVCFLRSRYSIGMHDSSCSFFLSRFLIALNQSDQISFVSATWPTESQIRTPGGPTLWLAIWSVHVVLPYVSEVTLFDWNARLQFADTTSCRN